jgi:hypothetical protein
VAIASSKATGFPVAVVAALAPRFVHYACRLGPVKLACREPAGSCRSHTIIEAHPAVLARMRAEGWMSKPNVRVVEGRWQDVLPQLETYDGIFFDTYDHHHMPAGFGSGHAVAH